jgi:hypothetical protein
MIEKLIDTAPEKPRRGRPAMYGETRKVSITLLPETWDWLDDAIKNGHAANRSELLRNIIEGTRN